MKILGKITDITLGYQQEKTSEHDGSKFWGERYIVFVESGDDTIMADTKWLHCQGKNGGLEILRRRGIFIGAQGEMTIRFSVREWNDRKFREATIESWKAFNQPEQPKKEAEPETPALSQEEGILL